MIYEKHFIDRGTIFKRVLKGGGGGGRQGFKVKITKGPVSLWSLR